MNLPIVEQIAVKILEALTAIKKANGYSNDAIAIRLNKKRGFSPQNNHVILEQESPAFSERQFAGFISWDQPFVVSCIIIESETSTIAIDTRVNALRADVEKAIAADPHWDSLAMNTIFNDPDYFDMAEGGIAGVDIRFTVTYRTSYEDPYSQTGSS